MSNPNAGRLFRCVAMQLVFLDRNTLAYKDYGFVDKQFDINVDMVIIQKSSFVVNKSKLNTTIGDIVILKEKRFPYLGLIERLEVADEHQTTVHTLDIRELFSIDIPALSYQGDLALYLQNLLNTHFKSSSDPLQNLAYLTILKEATVMGELNFEEDKILSLSSIIELITKSYGLTLTAEATYIRGRVTGITFRINEVNRGIKLKSNLKVIQDLVVNDSSSQMVNKVVFYPKKDNQTYKNTINYYLLTNSEITTQVDHPQRYKNVIVKSLIYSDSDHATLLTKARGEMLSSKLDHNITFSIKTDNEIIKPNQSIRLGDFIEFIKDETIYDSVVTGIRFKDGFHQAMITLGEYRIKLTEKIQLLNKSVSSAVSNISISTSGYTDLDGGEF